MSFLFIKRRVYDINILLIEPVDRLSQPLAEALIVDYLALAEITYDVVYIRVVAETQDIVIGQSSFLFGGHVLVEVGNDVSGHGHSRRAPRRARSKLRIYTGRVVYKIGIKARLFDFVRRHAAGELVNDSAYHLKVPELFCAQRSIGNVPMYQI